jgi:hypothetical protein
LTRARATGSGSAINKSRLAEGGIVYAEDLQSGHHRKGTGQSVTAALLVTQCSVAEVAAASSLFAAATAP